MNWDNLGSQEGFAKITFQGSQLNRNPLLPRLIGFNPKSGSLGQLTKLEWPSLFTKTKLGSFTLALPNPASREETTQPS